MTKKIAIVTSLIGAYDNKLLEIRHDDRFDFICYTNLRLKSKTWDIRYVDSLAVPFNNAKSSYYYKWNPHKYLDHEKYDTMIWVDSSVVQFNINGLNMFLNKHVENNTALYIEKHPSRNSLVDELNANCYLNKDDINTMKSQVQNYFNMGYDDSDTVMVETGFSIRQYKDEKLIEFSEMIWNEMFPNGKTKRDQLVFDYCMWKTQFKSISYFTFRQKCDVLMFQDHPNRADYKEKIALIGPWLGEDKYEGVWVDHVAKYVFNTPLDKIIVGCRPNREYMYDIINPDRFILSDPIGEKYGNTIDGKVPTFNITNTENKSVTSISPTNDWFKPNKYVVFKQKKDEGVMKVNVYYNYYIDNFPERQKELSYCLEQLISNRNIDNIFLLCDQYYDVSFDKCVQINVGYRPTYSDIFNIINSVTYDNDINVIINSDCFFDDDSAILMKIFMGNDDCWAVSRHELIDVNDKNCELISYSVGSQDAWIIKGKAKQLNFSDFTMGRAGCDNRIAYEFRQAGYNISNPANDIIIYHYHNTNIRHYASADRVPEPYITLDVCNIKKGE